MPNPMSAALAVDVAISKPEFMLGKLHDGLGDDRARDTESEVDEARAGMRADNAGRRFVVGRWLRNVGHRHRVALGMDTVDPLVAHVQRLTEGIDEHDEHGLAAAGVVYADRLRVEAVACAAQHLPRARVAALEGTVGQGLELARVNDVKHEASSSKTTECTTSSGPVTFFDAAAIA